MNISDRADRFAKKFAKPKPVEDTRSKDEKMAEFRRDWITDKKSLRAKIKEFRHKGAGNAD
jgi:hypothetical protein